MVSRPTSSACRPVVLISSLSLWLYGDGRQGERASGMLYAQMGKWSHRKNITFFFPHSLHPALAAEARKHSASSTVQTYVAIGNLEGRKIHISITSIC